MLVTSEIRDHVAIVSLNRPEKLNAIGLALLTALVGQLAAALDSTARVILLRAEGRAFCAGDDLDEFLAIRDRPSAEHFVGLLQEVSRLLMFGGKPVVCAARGYAVGAGAAWLLNADICVAGTDTVLFCPEAKYGLFPSGGASILLAERCGPARAASILWLGERVVGPALLAEGIVSRVVEPHVVDAEAFRLAGEVAALPESSRRQYKQARLVGLGDRLAEALAYEAAYCINAVDAVEGRAAVAEQMSPAAPGGN